MIPPSFVLRRRIGCTLAIVAFFLLFAPVVSWTMENLLVVFFFLMLVIGVLAITARSWMDLGIVVTIVSVFIGARIFFPALPAVVFAYRSAAIMAFVFFSATLLIGPWDHFIAWEQSLTRYRRHMGVTTFLLASFHSVLVARVYFDYSLSALFSLSFVFFGITAYYILCWLAMTSWDVVQKRVPMRWWIVVHTVAAAGYGLLLFFLNKNVLDLGLWMVGLITMFVVFWIAVAPWSLPAVILYRVNGWKQLHVLVYIAYVATVEHIWAGTAQFSVVWVQVLFWLLVIFVGGSHAVGWMMVARDFWRRRSVATGGEIMKDGLTYYFVDDAASFVEGKGRRFDVHKVPTAVFLHDGKFFAMSHLCPHQGGPIADGKIVDGFVVCPWHRYTWSITDGRGPAEYGDCIPYYPVHVQDGNVYVSPQCSNNCCQEAPSQE